MSAADPAEVSIDETARAADGHYTSGAGRNLQHACGRDEERQTRGADNAATGDLVSVGGAAAGWLRWSGELRIPLLAVPFPRGGLRFCCRSGSLSVATSSPFSIPRDHPKPGVLRTILIVDIDLQYRRTELS